MHGSIYIWSTPYINAGFHLYMGTPYINAGFHLYMEHSIYKCMAPFTNGVLYVRSETVEGGAESSRACPVTCMIQPRGDAQSSRGCDGDR